MAKEQRYIDYLTRLAKQGTKTLNIRGSRFTEEESFDIVTVMVVLKQNPVIVTSYIVPLLQDLVKQHNEDIIKISRTILDTPQMLDDKNLKRLTLYILGKNFKDSYDKMSTDEQEKYIINIAPGFGIYSEDRVGEILKYLMDLIQGEADRGNTGPSNTIERISVSDFKDNEIDHMILLRGLF